MRSCKDVVCSSCVLEKLYQEYFNKHASWNALAPLQLVYNDLCGHLPIVYFSSFKYLLTFTDDYSIRTLVYFLKIKSEVFDMFLAYKALIEKQSGQHILNLISDNGAEYVISSTHFALTRESKCNTLFCIHGIKMV